MRHSCRPPLSLGLDAFSNDRGTHLLSEVEEHAGNRRPCRVDGDARAGRAQGLEGAVEGEESSSLFCRP